MPIVPVAVSDDNGNPLLKTVIFSFSRSKCPSRGRIDCIEVLRMGKGIELYVRGCYYNGRRIETEKGELLRGSREAQLNAIATLLKILQRIDAEQKEKDEQPKAG